MKNSKRITILAAILLLPAPAFPGPKLLGFHPHHPGYEETDQVNEGMKNLGGCRTIRAEAKI
jgi:hypothetical protein